VRLANQEGARASRSSGASSLGALIRARLYSGGARVVAPMRTWKSTSWDAILYFAAAAFALGTLLSSRLADYRQWGAMAIGPYVLSGLIVLYATVRLRRRSRLTGAGRSEASKLSGLEQRSLSRLRLVAMGIALVGALVVPLAFEVSWGSHGPALEHEQPEVLVVEHAGDRLLKGAKLYQLPRPGHVAPKPAAGGPAYSGWFPYLPAMATLGLLHGSRDIPKPLTDARILFTLVSLSVVLLALAMVSDSKDNLRWRALQVVTVLPTAALPLVTGGDDLPVIAFMVLGLAFLARRRPGWAGLAMGIAASMKLTAWPLLALAPLASFGKDNKRHPVVLALAASVVLGPAIIPSLVTNPIALLDNVVRYPLGLSGSRSPAGSPMPGHVLASVIPAGHIIVPAVVAIALVSWLVHRLWRRPIQSASDLAIVVGWASLFVILAAPQARFGYLIYPVNLLLWGCMLSRYVPEPSISKGESTPSKGLSAKSLKTSLAYWVNEISDKLRVKTDPLLEEPETAPAEAFGAMTPISQ
jgi:hypothetical protein